ncbi:MAG: EAL domain-containing protein [Alphaproteobacteria bacterium]|nr:EAL domain-containing protein [Alphaproteobacteria bacterium]
MTGRRTTAETDGRSTRFPRLAARVADAVRAWGPGSATPAGIRQLHLLVALIAPALMLATIVFMADRQNIDARAAELRRADSVQTYLVDRIELSGVDNANWDEAYRHIVKDFNRDWIDSSLGPDAYGTIDFQDVFILGPSGETLYASLRGRVVAASAVDMLGAQFGYLLGRAETAVAPDGAAAMISLSGRPAMASLVRIQPIDTALAGPGDPVRWLLVVKHLDDKTLAEISKASGFRNLRVIATDARAPVSAPVLGIDDRPIARLAWDSDMPGFASAVDVLPIAGIVFLLLAYAGIVGASTARRRAEELVASRAEAMQLARVDALTELTNRRGFAQRVAAALAAGDEVALVYLDLDGFKEVNDAFGHSIGDALLVEAARRLRDVSPTEPSRFGGDEFAVLIHGRRAIAGRARALAQTIVDRFAEPLEAEGHKVYVGASVGVAVGGRGIDADELVRRGDVAMYAAKAAGKRRWRLYEPALEEGRDQRRQIAAELRESLAAGGIEVQFQPVVRASDERIVAAEALARWKSPTLGAIDPDRFIAIAEEAGLISDLTRQVLRRACEEAAGWRVDISVNLSAAEVWDLAFADELVRILRDTGMPPERLILEITESRLVRDIGATAATLGMLRDLGVRIALDDFGTGFASLQQLGRLPLDGLKLTRAFLVSAAGAQAADAAAAVVKLAAALGLPVVAEGVETRSQADAFRAAGCTLLQGWLFGKPMSAAAFADRLARADAGESTAA